MSSSVGQRADVLLLTELQGSSGLFRTFGYSGSHRIGPVTASSSSTAIPITACAASPSSWLRPERSCWHDPPHSLLACPGTVWRGSRARDRGIGAARE